MKRRPQTEFGSMDGCAGCTKRCRYARRCADYAVQSKEPYGCSSKRGPVIHIYVCGNVVDQDRFARELLSAVGPR